MNLTISARRRIAVAVVAAAVTAIAPVANASSASATTLNRVQQVLQLLNQQRASNGLAPLVLNGKLTRAARAHSQTMATTGVLMHQLPGEVGFGQRITNAGYRWAVSGENIGMVNLATAAGSVTLQNLFYNEVAPNNSHRINILSTRLTQVGIAIVVDTRGRQWLTQDFGQPV